MRAKAEQMRKGASRTSDSRPRSGAAASVWQRGPAVGAVTLVSFLMISLGVVMSYSATAPLALDETLPPLFLKHLSAACLGVVCAWCAMRISLRSWRRAALPLWCLGVGLLALTAGAGVEVNGARRWLELPGLAFRFQPSELAKLFTLVAVAAILARRENHKPLPARRGLVAVGLTIPLMVLLLLQPDLGSSALLCALVGLMLMVAGLPLRRLVPPLVLAPGVLWLYVWQHPYALRRLTAFWDPWNRAQNEGFQLVQSFVAFSVGGLDGVGLGNGRQKLFYLPEVHTDFILALIAEELGLIGVLLVLGAFAALVVAGTHIARRARDPFALLLAIGMIGFLALPAMVNAGVVMGLLPTKGLTLPFLSYGRTSLLVCCMAVGILLGVARDNPRVPITRSDSMRPWSLAWRSAG